jgi:hypothetical protein
MIDPQLFAIKMELKTNSLEPKSFTPAPSMAYATPENSAQYLELINTDQEAVFLELAPFIRLKTNCYGAIRVPPKYWRGPPLAEGEHPALLNWKIDLPEIWKIINDDSDFAGAKVLRFQITSVEWLRRKISGEKRTAIGQCTVRRQNIRKDCRMNQATERLS